MGRPRVYPDEFRERAVRLVHEWRKERGVAEGGLQPVADQLGINRETLRRWVVEQEVEAGDRPGITQAERSRIRELERENRELKRANEILKTGGCRTDLAPGRGVGASNLSPRSVRGQMSQARAGVRRSLAGARA